MKKGIVIGGILVIMVAFQAMAQSVEIDDMYFNAKDRERLKSADAESVSSSTVSKKKTEKETIQEAEPVEENTNPTDSYSARNINPEYVSRSNSAQASEQEGNYYVEGYTPNTYDSYSATNYSNTYNNNAYGNYPYSGYGYNPYSCNCYNPYMMSPYGTGSGWTLALSYYSGSGWGSGWNYGLGYSWGNAWGSSYYSPYNSFYYSPYSYYSPYYGGYSYDVPTRNYGKRPSRNTVLIKPTQLRTVAQNSSSTTNTSGSRMRKPVEEYYVKPFKRATNPDWSGISSDPTQRGNSNYSRTRSSGTTPGYTTPSRSNHSYSSPSRSSFGSPGRSGGGGGGSMSRPRGRN